MGDSSSRRPGLAILRGRGVVPRRRLVLKEGLRRVAAPNGPRSPAWGGRGVLPRRVSLLKKGPRGVAVPYGPG